MIISRCRIPSVVKSSSVSTLSDSCHGTLTCQKEAAPGTETDGSASCAANTQKDD